MAFLFNKMFGNLRKDMPSVSQLIMAAGGLGVTTLFLKSLQAYLSKKVVSRVYISSKDEAFHWLMFWLSEHEYAQSTNQFTVLTSKTHFDFSTHFFNASPTEKDKHKIPVKFVPAPGTHFIKFEGKWIRIEYQRLFNSASGTSNINSMSQVGGNGDVSEYIIVSTLSTAPDFLKRFIMNTQDTYIRNKHGKTLVYVPDTFCDVWEPRICRQKRDPKTVVLESGIFDELLEDARKFLQLQTWYHERGIPFRRGYLLHGPPGTGKTSCVTALAAALDMNICMVHLSNKNLSDDKLNSLLLNTPYSSIILLEDIDHALESASHSQKRKSEDNEDEGVVTLAGLLNCIDGVIAQEGRLVFMTTNHVHHLPPALTRPGRVDVSKVIDYASDSQIQNMFLNFYPNEQARSSQFIHMLKVSMKDEGAQPKITTAALQGHFLKYKEDASRAVANAKEVLHLGHFE